MRLIISPLTSVQITVLLRSDILLQAKKMFSIRHAGRVLHKLGSRNFNTSLRIQGQHSYQFVVVGGGAGGLAMASTLNRKFPKCTAIIEPSEVRELDFHLNL